MTIAKKIMLLGAMAVGKTAIATRLKLDRFDQDYKSTIGVELHTLELDVDGNSRPVIVWDTDGDFGQTIFESVYIKGAAGALIVADVTRGDTVEHMMELRRNFEDHLPGRPSLCVLNKCDLELPQPERMKVLRKEADDLVLCSAKTGDGVTAAMVQLYKTIVAREL